MNLARELQVTILLAVKAGARLRRYQDGQTAPRFKVGGELVTEADLESDKIIRSGLTEAFPNDPVYSEEAMDSPERLSRNRVWIVDPLDSTSNFIAQGDEYTVSIGLAVQRKAVLGVVYNPRRKVLFAGYLGAGVTFNGSPVQTTNVSEVATARIAVSRTELHKGNFANSQPPLSRPLSSMAYKLARVAAGMDDAVISLKPRKEWGTCAGVALVLAARGRATLLDGSEIQFNRRELKQPMGMIACGAALHETLLRRFGATAAPGQESVFS